MTFRGFAPSITINNFYHHQYPFQLTVNMFKFQTNKTLLISPSFHSLTSQNSSPYFLILCFYPSLLDPEQSGFCFWLYTEIDKIFFSLCTPWYWRLCFLKVVFSLVNFPKYYAFLVPFSEKAMAPHSSTFAWKIPWTKKNLLKNQKKILWHMKMMWNSNVSVHKWSFIGTQLGTFGCVLPVAALILQRQK